jgi:hypothetical protein
MLFNEGRAFSVNVLKKGQLATPFCEFECELSRPADETGTVKDRAISLVSFRSSYAAHPCRA